jgi:hypothetical protein
MFHVIRPKQPGSDSFDAPNLPEFRNRIKARHAENAYCPGDAGMIPWRAR